MKRLQLNKETIYVNSIEDLTDSQRQDLAERLVNREIYCSCTSEVEFILGASIENDNAPFSYDDVVGGRFAEVQVRGDYIEVYEDEKEDLIESLVTGIEILESRISSLEESKENQLQSIEEIVNECIESDKCDILAQSRYDTLESRYDDILLELNIRLETLNDSIDNLENAYFEAPEVMQWFSCSTWFAEQMSVYINRWGYWGRTGYGQAISLDSDIQELAFNTYSSDMGLEIKNHAEIDYTNKNLVKALSCFTYPMLDKMSGASQVLYVEVCNRLYKRQRTPQMICNSGKYSFNVLSRNGEIIDTVCTVSRLGSTTQSNFYAGLVQYLEDC